jgi:hypothetical protein
VRWFGVVLALVLSGCPDSNNCPGLGDPCTVLCCSGLSCRATDTGGTCGKSCRCHGSAICASTQFQEGCPQGSACLAKASDGTGECVRLCDTSPCSPGQVVCEDPHDAGITCSIVPPLADLGAPRG